MKLSHLYWVLALFLLSSTNARAQSDAPVMSDIIRLVDLLKKDYNLSPAEGREEEIATDRRLVIVSLSAYLTDDQRPLSDQQKDLIQKKNKEVIKTKQAFNAAKLELAAYNNSVLKTQYRSDDDQLKSIGKYAETSKKMAGDLEELKKKMYTARFNLDVAELEILRDTYKKSNKYLEIIIELFIAKYTELEKGTVDTLAAPSYRSSLQKSLPFVGGDLGFETVIDGLGRFLADRIREELTNNVIESIKKSLTNVDNDDPITELKLILPRTTAYLVQFQSDRLINFANEIRAYIEDDLNHLLENAALLKNSPNVIRLIEKNPNLRFVAEGISLINDISKVRHPIDYFSILQQNPVVTEWKNVGDLAQKNLSNVLGLSSLLAHSFLMIEDGQPKFASMDLLNYYAGDYAFYALYMGLLYQQDIKFYQVKISNTSLQASLEAKMKFLPDKNWVNAEKAYLMGLLQRVSKNIEKVNNLTTDIRKAKKAGAKIGADTIYIYVDNMIALSRDFTDAGSSFIDHYFISSDTLNLTVTKRYIDLFLETGASMNDITRDLLKKNYAIAIIKTLEIVDKLRGFDIKSQDIKLLSTNLQQVVYDSDLKKWEAVVKFINGASAGETVVVKRALQEDCARIFPDFEKVKARCLRDFPQLRTLNDQLNALEKILVNLKKGEAFIMPDGAQLGQIKEALNASEPFRRTLILQLCNDNSLFLLQNLEAALAENVDLETFKRDINALMDFIYSKKILGGNGGGNYDVKLSAMQHSAWVIASEYGATNLLENDKLIKLIYFINDMAAAEDAEEVKKAIDAIALPVGSYAIKRNAARSIAINSFPGLVAGGEFSLSDNTFAFSPGFTAPVGISFTLGTKKGRSIGFFMPIIDIAAVTRLHFDQNNTVKTLPPFAWSNIIAPGLYWHTGFKSTPLSFQIGGQYGPSLKKILSNGDTENREVFFIGAGLVLDIPIYNLHTKPRF